MIFEVYLIVVSSLLILSVLTSKATGWLGVPSLLVFLAIGMMAGSEGIGHIQFHNALYAQTLGVIALIYILFAGGLDTELKTIRPIIFHATVLGTVGVFLTSLLTGWFAKKVLGFTWLEGMLLGSIVCSTDAAAVFTVLRERNIGFKGQVKPLLEFESGANDPMAVFLTIGILALIKGTVRSPLNLISDFLRQIVLGGAIGPLAGKAMGTLLNRLKLSFDGLYPVMSLALVLLVYGITQTLGGSGFLAVYLAGLFLGKEVLIHRKSLILFHDGIAWLMQITMFLCLGLLVLPSRLGTVAGNGLLISGFLIFVARPFAVFVSLLGTSFSSREKAMIAWVGLRGSVPIILATYPLLAGIQRADSIFNLVFFIVISSVLIQGPSISFVARLLKLDFPVKPRFRYPLEYVPTGDLKSDLVEIEIPPHSFMLGKSIFELGLPKDALIVLIQRRGHVIVPKGSTQIEAGDTMLVLAEQVALYEIRKIAQGRARA